jgi:HSP20 family protein
MVRIIRRQPFPLDDLQMEMNRVLGGLFQAPAGPAQTGPAPLRVELEVGETEAAYVVRVELPGVDPKALELTATADRLVVAGEKPDPWAEQGGRLHGERRFGAFRRELELPGEVDPAAVSAEHAHGVLTVTLPKSAALQPRRIEVQGS